LVQLVKRAAQLFALEERASSSNVVELTWRTRSEPAESFISVAVSHWEMVITRQRGTTRLTVRGPETRATTVPIPKDAEFVGIQFRAGTFMPSLPLARLVDRALTLPGVTNTSFWLNGSAWAFPNYDDADAFVDRLTREGLLVRDAVVEAALQDDDVNDLSVRTVQRRVLRATGLTRCGIRQIERAETAVALLSRGVSIPDTVRQVGYSDQAHLTRSVRRFAGQTPAQVVNSFTSE
jgi:helix-turn-helix protein